ncbi:hypothetical protein P175DRAFT_0531230 [Aspergillus ochraceoroseus IBT 24754]|uniref:Uncharacterized protein n=1 Tax=Aspergillus ochraceoroseus IBT 24754 TaxID=1392256 RepID=A0A2T5LZK2_9EURO|nr:uncharacterized protein P175DRAFT_0531230 [Aspergillus ochraceoroseus IBT 24754]PTU21710.1 hypothetical protein P175DRAFT_0531230 [Aspergillus ochraceoroseus IBT 24754]
MFNQFVLKSDESSSEREERQECKLERRSNRIPIAFSGFLSVYTRRLDRIGAPTAFKKWFLADDQRSGPVRQDYESREQPPRIGVVFSREERRQSEARRGDGPGDILQKALELSNRLSLRSKKSATENLEAHEEYIYLHPIASSPAAEGVRSHGAEPALLALVVVDTEYLTWVLGRDTVWAGESDQAALC